MKAAVCAHKVNTREELLQPILSAARSINKAAVLHKVTSSLVTRVRKFNISTSRLLVVINVCLVMYLQKSRE